MILDSLRKRRGCGVSRRRRRTNITQHSLFRATGEAGARNRNDLEHTGIRTFLTVVLPHGRHFHCTSTSFPFSFVHDVARTRTAGFYQAAGRSTSRQVLLLHSLLPPFLPVSRRVRIVYTRALPQGRTILHLSPLTSHLSPLTFFYTLLSGKLNCLSRWFFRIVPNDKYRNEFYVGKCDTHARHGIPGVEVTGNFCRTRQI